MIVNFFVLLKIFIFFCRNEFFFCPTMTTTNTFARPNHAVADCFLCI